MRQQLDSELSGLTLYPVATSMRTKGVKGGDADLTHIHEAIALAQAAPELITARLWAWLESGSRYEAVRRAMPTGAKWFIPTSARMPFDAALRLQHVRQVTPSVPLLSALLAEAPFDYWTATEYLELTRAKLAGAKPAGTQPAGAQPPQPAQKPSSRQAQAAPPADGQASAPVEAVAPPHDSDLQRVLGPRLEYDLRAIRVAIEHVKDDEAALALRERGCELAVTECVRYAWALVNMDRADDAARQFERTFADPNYDRVSFSNEAGWLVTYYWERKQSSARWSWRRRPRKWARRKGSPRRAISTSASAAARTPSRCTSGPRAATTIHRSSSASTIARARTEADRLRTRLEALAPNDVPRRPATRRRRRRRIGAHARTRRDGDQR